MWNSQFPIGAEEGDGLRLSGHIQWLTTSRVSEIETSLSLFSSLDLLVLIVIHIFYSWNGKWEEEEEDQVEGKGKNQPLASLTWFPTPVEPRQMEKHSCLTTLDKEYLAAEVLRVRHKRIVLSNRRIRRRMRKDPFHALLHP